MPPKPRARSTAPTATAARPSSRALVRRSPRSTVPKDVKLPERMTYEQLVELVLDFAMRNDRYADPYYAAWASGHAVEEFRQLVLARVGRDVVRAVELIMEGQLHVVARVGDLVIDWAARRFDPGAPYPSFTIPTGEFVAPAPIDCPVVVGPGKSGLVRAYCPALGLEAEEKSEGEALERLEGLLAEDLQRPGARERLRAHRSITLRVAVTPPGRKGKGRGGRGRG